MARLSPRDLGQALDFLHEAEDVEDPDPFPAQLLDRLRDLVPADAVSWHEWGVDGRHHSVISTSRLEETRAVWDAYPRYRRQDPLPGGCPGAGPPSPALVGRALKFSDLLTLREFHRLELHAFVCRPLGVDYVMKLFLPNDHGVARGLVFDRGGRDFSERDRLLVDLLHPHFVALYDAARSRRVLAVLEGHEGSDGSLVVVGRNGVIEFAEPRARELLNHYFGPPKATCRKSSKTGFKRTLRGSMLTGRSRRRAGRSQSSGMLAAWRCAAWATPFFCARTSRA